eukprot:PhM_4_TR10191/c0_g1_i1/m.82337
MPSEFLVRFVSVPKVLLKKHRSPHIKIKKPREEMSSSFSTHPTNRKKRLLLLLVAVLLTLALSVMTYWHFMSTHGKARRTTKLTWRVVSLLLQLVSVAMLQKASSSSSSWLRTFFYASMYMTIIGIPILFLFLYTSKQDLTTELLGLLVHLAHDLVIITVTISNGFMLIGDGGSTSAPSSTASSTSSLCGLTSSVQLTTSRISRRSLRRLVVLLGITVVVSLVALQLTLTWAPGRKRSLFVGLWDTPQHHCYLDILGGDASRLPFPWISLLPRRTLNFFTGSESCPSISFSSSYHVVEGDKIEIRADCLKEFLFRIASTRPDENGDDAFTVLWERTEFSRSSSSSSSGITYTVPAGIESVDVQCGQESRRHIFYNQRKNNNNNEKASAPPPVRNVLVLVIDAVSRPWLLRSMPLTVAALEARRRNVFQFLNLGLNGHATTDNIAPVLTGGVQKNFDKLSEDAIRRMYLPAAFRAQHNVESFFTIGVCQDYLQKHIGARHNTTPANWRNSTTYANFCSKEEYPATAEGNFLGPFSILRRCLSDTYVHTHIFNYLRSMWDIEVKHRKKNVFTYALFSEGHEGTQAVLPLMDKELAEFLFDERFNAHETAILLMADHGHHMGPYYEWSRAGRLEHLIPSFFMILPDSMIVSPTQESLSSQLRKHEQTMLSVYDVHRTLAHLIDYPRNTTLDAIDDFYRRNNNTNPVFDSLLRLPQQQQNQLRSCDTLKIPPKYCLTYRCKDEFKFRP